MSGPLFRPPAEADSLILQVDRGCPYNQCTFCGMYREVAYRKRDLDDALSLVSDAARRSPGADRIFLADGDVMRRPFGDLQALLQAINAGFPRLSRVSLYANGRSIGAKTMGELHALRALKLHTLYMGLESGHDDVLAGCRKRETAQEMVDAAVAAQVAGLRMSVMVLLGLGGVERSGEHAANTAGAVNRMQPRLLSALRVVPVPGTPLYGDVTAGRFRQLTEQDVVRELRAFIAGLDLRSTVFRANHSSNVVPVEARFPRDKARVLAELDALLASGELDAQTPGPMPLWL